LLALVVEESILEEIIETDPDLKSRIGCNDG